MFKKRFLFCLIYIFLNQIKDSIISIECNDRCFHLKHHTNCMCTNDCLAYNDCCVDVNKTNTVDQISSKYVGCNVKLSNNKWVYSIDKCNVSSNQKVNSDLIEKCQLKHNNLMNLIPVYYQNRTYKNIYCVLCNFDQLNEDHLKFYELNMNDPANLEQMNISNLTELILSNQNDEYSFNLPDININQRYCVKSIETCWLNATEADKEKCKNYTSYRYYLDENSNNHIYKNEHCAKCNGVKSDQLRCQATRPRFFHQNLQILFDLKNLHGELKIELNIQTDSLNKSMIITNEFFQMTNIMNKKHETINKTKNIITFVGQIISIISLTLLLFIYFSNRKLRNLGGKILISLCVSLLLSQIMFLISGLFNYDLKENSTECFLIGLFTHYFYLVFFFWTNVMSYDLYNMFNKTNVNTDEKKFMKYSIYAWIVPFLIIILNLFTQILTKKTSYGSTDKCFISNSLDQLIFFILPVFCILLTNCYYLFCSIRSINEVDRSSKKYLKDSSNFFDQKKRIFLYLKLFLLFGMSWSLGIINSIIDSSILWYAYIVLNSFQGFFVLISFTFNSQTKRHLKDMQWYSLLANRNSNSNSNTKSTSISVYPPQTASSNRKI